jgi:hypothetical protein
MRCLMTVYSFWIYLAAHVEYGDVYEIWFGESDAGRPYLIIYW